MKIKRLASGGAAVALALGLAASANAELITVTFQGVVNSGSDLTGAFGVAGADLTGDSYTAVYTINDAVNSWHDYEPPILSHLLGGSIYLAAHDGGPGPAEESPVSATLTINGKTVSVPGVYLGNAWQAKGSGGEEYYYAEDNTSVGSVSYKDYLENQIESLVHPVTSTWDFHNPSSYTALPGDSINGTFYDYVQNTDTGAYLVDVTANLDPTSVSVVPGVPEPATWTLLILGVGMIGFAARRRNEGATLAV